MRTWTRRIALGVVTAAMVGGLAAVVVDYATRPALIAGPMLQLVEPDGFTVVWWATHPNDGTLEVGQPGSPLRRIAARTDGESGRLVASVTGLRSPDGLEYRVVHRSWIGLRHTIGAGRGRLAKRLDETLRFIAFGDSGSGKAVQYELGAAMPGIKADLVIHTGDLVYPSGRWADYGPHFFLPYEKLIKDVPFYPCLGNHDLKTDMGKPFLSTFELPANGPAELPRGANYWFDYGPARFVALNSCDSPSTLHDVTAPWLETVLASAGSRWRFVFFHQPPYTGSNHHPDARIQAALVPVLEKTGVDVVFCGHNHLYERTKAIRAGRVVPDGQGIYYIVTGAGGAKLYAERNNHPAYIATFTKDDENGFGFTVVDVAGDALRIRHINRLGKVVDDWAYTRRLSGRPAVAGSQPAANGRRQATRLLAS
jgi:predicted phosphodiesterase